MDCAKQVPTGELFRAYRRGQQLRQNELAGMLGISPSALSQIESGLNRPSLGVLVNFARLSKTSLDVLLGLSGEAGGGN